MNNIDGFLRDIASKQNDLLRQYRQALPQEVLTRFDDFCNTVTETDRKGNTFQVRPTSEIIALLNEADKLHNDIEANRDILKTKDLLTGIWLNLDNAHLAIETFVKCILCPAFMDEEQRRELKERVSEIDEVSRYRNYIINVDETAPFRASDAFRFIFTGTDYLTQEELNNLIAKTEAKDGDYTP